MRASVPIACLFLSSSVLAQSPNLTVQVDGQARADWNLSQCGSTHTINWTAGLSGTATACSTRNLRFWITLGSCGTDVDGGDYLLDYSVPAPDWATSGSGSANRIEVNRLPAFASVDGGCPASSIDVTHTLCASAPYAIGGACQTPTWLQANATVHFKSVPPTPPNIDGIRSSDGALTVAVSVSSDTVTFRLEYRQDGTADWTGAGPFSVATGGTGTARITGLQNNVRYEIRAFGKDAAGNESLASASVFQTPYQTQGFWGQYESAGGVETGGCRVGGGSIAMALLGLGILTLARSRRWG